MVTAEAREQAESQRRRDYVDRTVRVWLGLPRSADVQVPRPPAHLERRFLRLEEYERKERDAWDCWDHSFSENFLDGQLGVAEIDHWIVEQRDHLSRWTPLEPLWPSGKRFAACLTHDVDVLASRSTPGQLLRHAAAGLDYGAERRDLLRFARPPVRAAKALRAGVARSPSTIGTLDESTAAEVRRGATASYFFTVPGGGSRYDCTYAPTDRCTFRGVRTSVAGMIRELAADGFDVGLHGSYFSAVKPDLLVRERELLERATGLSVTTTRQHFLHWDIARTPQLQAGAGFTADSSLGFNRAVGYRASTSLPFRHFDVTADRALPLLIVPLIVEDSALLGPIASVGGLDNAREATRRLVDAARDTGGALTFLFHPDKLVRPDWLALYEWSLSYVAENGGWITSVDELERWWTARERRLLDG